MSGTIPPSDGGYNYYKREVEALEEELRTERKRNQSKEERRIAKNEEARLAEKRKNDEQLARTISAVKEEASGEIRRERVNAQAEVDRMKAQNYDRFGRSNGLEADTLKAELDVQVRSSELERAQHKRQLQTSDQVHSDRMGEAYEKANRIVEENTRRIREDAASGYERLNQERRAELEDTKLSQQKLMDLNNAKHAEELNTQRTESARNRADLEAESSAKLARAELSASEKHNALSRAAAEEMRLNTQAMKDSHTRETSQLREKAQLLSDSQGSYMKDKGNGSAAARKEMETEWMNREKNVIAAYDTEIEQLKHKAKETDAYFNRLNNQTLKDKDTYFAGIIANQNSENARAQKELEANFQSNYAQLRHEAERDQKNAAEAHGRKMEQANRQMNDALDTQARTYGETMRRQKESDEDTANRLRKEIAFKSSDDITAASPALEAKLREQIGAAHEKNLKAEFERNRASEGHMFEDLSKRMRDVVSEKDRANSTQQMHQEALRQFEKSQFLDTVADLQYSTQNAIKTKDLAHEREAGNMNRNYAQVLQKQRREYEEMIEVLRADSSNKLQALRQESEFNSKMAQRTFAAKQNDLIRENEKKLADQKTRYEDQLEEMRSQSQKTQQESERRVRGALEEQARSYEQRIAQIELQAKERERFTAQSYEDQLEKVRRTNAELAKRRG